MTQFQISREREEQNIGFGNWTLELIWVLVLGIWLFREQRRALIY